MDNNFHFHTLVLVSKSWNGKRTLKVKAEAFNEVYLKEEKKRLIDVADKRGTCPDYRVLGPRQLKALQEEVKGEQAARRATGAKKAAATRKKNGPSFILCPTCGCEVQEAVQRVRWAPDAEVPARPHLRVRQVAQ